MAKDKRSRDQKRKNKKVKQAGKMRKGESLAYSGDKYKAGDLAAFWMETEVAIYELYVISGRTLLDRTVYSAVETFVKKLRAKTLPPLSEDKVTFDRSRKEDLQYEADFLIGMSGRGHRSGLAVNHVGNRRFRDEEFGSQ